jgi:hypothetical protein
MALAFESEKFFIPNSKGANSQTETAVFPRNVNIADVALKEFKLEFTGPAAPTDTVQMGCVVTDDPKGTNNVQIKLSYNYSGGEYRGHAIVLVIADIEDAKP